MKKNKKKKQSTHASDFLDLYSQDINESSHILSLVYNDASLKADTQEWAHDELEEKINALLRPRGLGAYYERGLAKEGEAVEIVTNYPEKAKKVLKKGLEGSKFENYACIIIESTQEENDNPSIEWKREEYKNNTNKAFYSYTVKAKSDQDWSFIFAIGFFLFIALSLQIEQRIKGIESLKDLDLMVVMYYLTGASLASFVGWIFKKIQTKKKQPIRGYRYAFQSWIVFSTTIFVIYGGISLFFFLKGSYSPFFLLLLFLITTPLTLLNAAFGLWLNVQIAK